jgi:hypothetical protein
MYHDSTHSNIFIETNKLYLHLKQKRKKEKKVKKYERIKRIKKTFSLFYFWFKFKLIFGCISFVMFIFLSLNWNSSCLQQQQQQQQLVIS